jgi:protein-tyrosine phosphatase
MQRILTLCIGNICRSPLAEVLLARELPSHQVWSAGLSALIGQPADPNSQLIAQEHGLDLSRHRAQQVSSIMCQQAEMILVMEQSHKAMLEQQFPVVRGKVFRIGQFGGFDIADPYHQPREAFDNAYAAIARGLDDWLPRIRMLSA